MKDLSTLPPTSPQALRTAQESLSIVTTLLLSPGSGQSSSKTFYAHFLMRMNTVWVDDKHPVKTLGVSITDKINLYIYPPFFNMLNSKQQMEVLEHEIEHIVYMHPLRAKDYLGEKAKSGKFKLANIAMDANINENKPALTKDLGVTIARLNKELEEMGSKDRLDIADPWEVHYTKLKQAAEENGGEGEGEFGETVDDHGIWEESTDNKEVAQGIIKDVANKAQNATGIGNMPEGMLREISNMNKSSVNWRRVLHQFATSALRFEFTKTRNRRNRRYGVVQPGRKKKPKLKIMACNDSSGSVSDAAFAQYFAELFEIQKMDIDITVIDADSQVQNVYDYDPKKPPQRKGYGGTAYQPAIDKAMELGADAIIYFGDMDSADTPKDPGVPFLWAVVGPQNPPGNFGRTVRVTVEGER